MRRFASIMGIFYLLAFLFPPLEAAAKEKVKMLIIPLADHYAALVAFEKYRSEMKEADFEVEIMKSWPALQGKFTANQAELAMVISPMAMNMHAEDEEVRWIGLAHRDGNALGLNELLYSQTELPEDRASRLPSQAIADVLAQVRVDTGEPVVVGLPSLQSTHGIVLYKFLKDYGYTLSFGSGEGDVVAKAVAPPKSPAFLTTLNGKGRPAAIEQSLPWADVVETDGSGRLAWYSRDVLQDEDGHVECIIIGHSESIEAKEAAIREVMAYIHKAGAFIEAARASGGADFDEVIEIVRKHIPSHTAPAIRASLNNELQVINYRNLNVDESGLQVIMDLAVEAGVMAAPIDIDRFADDRFHMSAVN